MKAQIIATVKIFWIIAVVIFISTYLYTHFNSIVKILDVIPMFNLIIAFSALFLAKVLLSYAALLSVRYVAMPISFSKMYSIYNITQLAKYIPGSIWQFVGRAGAYAKEGMSISNIKKSIFIEMLWVLTSAFVLGSLLVLSGDLFDFKFIIDKAEKYFLFYALTLMLFITITGYYYKKTFSLVSLFLQNYSLNIKMVITLIPIWFLLGMSFFITLEPYMQSISITQFIDIVGVYALAYAIGFLVPFAPAGIGIREAILVAGISSFISMEEAIVLASLNRIIYILLEIVIVTILLQFTIYTRYKSKKNI